MKKLVAVLLVAVFAVSMISITSISDQFADAGSRKKVHFTQTITSSQDPGQGHENHQLALILSPNQGTLYDGSMTFTSSEPVQIAVLHEINSQDAKGQPVWTVNGNTLYGLSLIDVGENSGSFEFTGAALALHSSDSQEFTATVSIDAWTRGQPTEVMMQKIEFEKDPLLLLSKTNVPATIPMHQGIYDGNQVLYIITDGSDDEYAKTLSEKQDWRVELAPPLADIPEDTLQNLYVFKNGIKGDGIYGFQDDVFSSAPSSQESEYSALSSVIEVTWKPGQKATLVESAADVIAAEEGSRVEFEKTGIVLNSPQIVWPDGQMKVRSDQEITDDMSYGGGQITEINEEEMTVTFVAHRGWGPDGRTVYYIVTDVTPSRPAETMGVAYSPLSANLISHSAAVDLFQFKNGIKGSGPLGFQPGIAGAVLGDEHYSPMWRIYLVEWHDAKSARVLETKSDIDSFRADDLISISIARPTNSDHIVNCPFIDPFQ